ncbi:MAG: class Ia ribonucleoside-diphosphate reductase subunit beta, partial [Psittacicella sp.]
DIVTNDEIVKRATDISKYYDDFINYSQLYALYGEGHTIEFKGKTITLNLREMKKLLYICLLSVNVLEAIRFYVSFACSFAFAERGLMEGNAKIIKLIARDESLHLSSTQYMINLMRTGKDDPEMKEIAEEVKDIAVELFLDAINQEKEWAEYLFKDGSMIGLNKDILQQYIEYISNIRMEAIGMPIMFEDSKTNPIPWINSWLSSEAIQVAPQEVEISSYLVGQIDSNIASDDFEDFDL